MTYCRCATQAAASHPPSSSRFTQVTCSRVPVQPGGEHQYREPGEAVAEPPHDRVDERLDLEGLVRRHRQVQQLHGRSVHRVAQHLVARPEHDDRRERAEQQVAHRPEGHGDRHHEEREAEPQAAQQAGGEEQLQRERQQPRPEVEAPEERRELVPVGDRLPRRALNCHAATAVTNDDKQMTAAMARRYLERAMSCSAPRRPEGPCRDVA